MTFRILCLFCTRFVFLQVPDIGSFPAGPEPVAGSTPPTYTPLQWSMSPSSSQPRGTRAASSAQGLEGENTSCLWAGCAPPPCLLPTVEPGTALPLLRCSRFPGKVAEFLRCAVKHGVAGTILNILYIQILRSLLMTWCQFCLRLIDKVLSVFAVLPKQSITVGNNYSNTNTKLKLLCSLKPWTNIWEWPKHMNWQ